MNGGHRGLGFACAIGVLLIWSTWLVVSRAGALSELTVYDLTALRYGVSAVLTLPVVLWTRPWETMSLGRIAVVTTLLGPLYILLVFGGFKYAPAAHGGIYMNGALPVVTLGIAWVWVAQRATAREIAGAIIVCIGVVMVVADSTALALGDAWLGDLMFFAAALSFGGYLVASRVWQITIPQLMLCSSVLNAILFVPIWWIALPSELGTVSASQFWLQVAYQGIVPNLIGLLLITYAVRSIGAAATSAFMAGVPGLGAILSLIILDERMGALGWTALVVLTAGIVLMTLKPRLQAAKSQHNSEGNRA